MPRAVEANAALGRVLYCNRKHDPMPRVADVKMVSFRVAIAERKNLQDHGECDIMNEHHYLSLQKRKKARS